MQSLLGSCRDLAAPGQPCDPVSTLHTKVHSPLVGRQVILLDELIPKGPINPNLHVRDLDIAPDDSAMSFVALSTQRNPPAIQICMGVTLTLLSMSCVA